MNKYLSIFAIVFIAAGCVGSDDGNFNPRARNQVPGQISTPTVDYIGHLDPHGAMHNDRFLTELTVNYRSFAIYNTDIAGFPELGEFFAQKALAAFSGQVPMPEMIDNWHITNPNDLFELRNACNDLLAALKNDAAVETPRLAGEAQGKFDCWLTATAVGNLGTAAECRTRFHRAIMAMAGNGGIIDEDRLIDHTPVPPPHSGFANRTDMPSTSELMIYTDTRRTRQGVVVVNNINVPADLIRPAPVHPVVFNQFIGGPAMAAHGDGTVGNEMVSREEFINMMMALRNEIREINDRIDNRSNNVGTRERMDEIAQLRVQQIPTANEPRLKLMEEIFEVKFDFNKSNIRPEFKPVIRQLAEAARNNSNVKISIVGHTDTVGSQDVNFMIGGRRAQAVRQMLIQNGVPASSIIILSSGKNDLAVQTGPNVKNQENRRARVIKEIRSYESGPAATAPAPRATPTGPAAEYGVVGQGNRAVPAAAPSPAPATPRNNARVAMPEPLPEEPMP